jgi:outer membrane immunogenic protein
MTFRFFNAAAASVLAISSAAAKPVDWTGWYWGANAGYSDAQAETERDLSGSGYFVASSVSDIEANSRFDLGKGGVTAGVQYGYNHKVGAAVIGAEIDFNYTDANDSGSVTRPYPCCGASYTSSAEFDQIWLATLRAKAGVPVGSALVYATGGLAFGEVEVQQGFGDTLSPLAFAAQNYSTTLAGWSAGGGVEIPIADGLALRLEYLYADLGDIDTGPEAFIGGSPGERSQTNAAITNQSIRLGVNWHY